MQRKTDSGIDEHQFESLDVHRRFQVLGSFAARQVQAPRSAARETQAHPAETLLIDTWTIVPRALVPNRPGGRQCAPRSL